MRLKRIESIDPEMKWMKLEKDKVAFLKIVKTLNRYYDSLKGPEKINPTSFRKRLTESDPDIAEIFFKKFGKYEFLVFARISSEGKSEFDSWIHIDGIRQEREELSGQNVTDHPVFSIRCLSDIYEDSCIPISESELEEIELSQA
ncbi:LIC_13246 family protein [Leptospira inadai]|nr:hypothetical protein [Leptospira inadai]PNV72591.1 hypothetical protein BES34_019110 [Leptospira inadai serovar Lyme]